MNDVPTVWANSRHLRFLNLYKINMLAMEIFMVSSVATAPFGQLERFVIKVLGYFIQSQPSIWRYIAL